MEIDAVASELSEIFGPGTDCLPVDELVRGLESGDGNEKQRHEQHLTACAYCSSQLTLFRTFESAKPSPEEQAAVHKIVSRLRKNSPAADESWWSRLWRPRILIPAAVSLAAASIMLVTTITPRSGNSEITVDQVTRSAQLTIVAPLGKLSLAPTRLQWQALDGASQYAVQLLEVDRTVLWKATTNSTSISIPESIRAAIVPAKKILWDVAAMNAAGNTVASSGIRSFVIEK